jgi:hypothetical protein
MASAAAVAAGLVALLQRSAIASDTGYGEGVVQLVSDTLFCAFDKEYYGDYYWTGVKFSDTNVQSCMSTSQAPRADAC